jgi:hypothetical protein
MSKSIAAGIILAAGLSVAGCDTMSPAAPYAASTPNVLAFQSALKPRGQQVRVGDFTSAAGVQAPTCRMAGTLDVTSGKTLAQYLKDALQTELFTAQVYDSAAPVVINGKLDQLQVNTFGSGSWTLGLQITSNQDPVGYHVTTVHTFASSFSAMAACQNAVNAFAPSVQELLGAVVNHAGFSKLAGGSTNIAQN